MEIEVRVLGSLEVGRAPGEDDGVRGVEARVLLALAVDAGRVVEDGDLLDRVWPAGPPRHGIASIRNHVARLRRRLGPRALERGARGYRLNVEASCLDLHAFATTVASARAHGDDAVTALHHLDAALAMVRGRPFDDVADELWAMPASAAAAEAIAGAEELWADVVIASGRGGDEVTRLRRASEAQPHREVRWRQLVAALAAAGRRTEGLRAVGEARRALAEFGLLPGTDVLDLERQLLGPTGEPAGGGRIPIRREAMVGRDAALAAVLQPVPIVWIEGEPGSGKTRLLAEAADRDTTCAAADPVLLYAACPRTLGSGARVMSALVAMARELGPATEPLPAELERWLDQRAPATTGAPGPAPDPEATRAALVSGAVSWLRAAGARRTVTVMVDDVDALDESALGFLTEVVDRTHRTVRWVLTSRRLDHQPLVADTRHRLSTAGPMACLRLDPLTPDDVADLVAALAPELVPDERAALAAEVTAATAGHALSVAELIAHRLRATDDGDPPRLDTIVHQSLGGLTPEGRRLVELLAVAGGPCPVSVASAACGWDPATVLETAERVEAAGLLAPVGTSVLDLRHDLIRRAVDRRLAPSNRLALRRSLVGELGRDPALVIAYADQLLQCGDLLDADDRDRRDGAVADAIERLMATAEYAPARRLADRYLTVGATGTGPAARRARLQAATALIASAEVVRGRVELARVVEQARAAGDLPVLADAILAVGPLATGSREREHVIADAEVLATTLPVSEARRQVQLACWAAHHRINRGDGVAASYLLARAEEASLLVPDLRGLVLGVRAQSDLLVGRPPASARRSLDELRTLACETGDVTADVAWHLLAARQAWVDGTVADVAAARDAVADVARRMPRPDLQWWPLVFDASIEIAVGPTERAAAAVEEAARVGRQLGVEVAGSSAMAQQLQLLILSGGLAEAAPSFERMVAVDGASSQLISAYGLACAEAGRHEATVEAAARLAADPQLLVAAGMGWGQVAMCASEVAFVAEDVALAELLWRSLEPYCGFGLALPGAGYFGAADRCLGLLAATLGDDRRAEALLVSARAQEHRRGTVAWERRSVAGLRAVRAARSVPFDQVG